MGTSRIPKSAAALLLAMSMVLAALACRPQPALAAANDDGARSQAVVHYEGYDYNDAGDEVKELADSISLAWASDKESQEGTDGTVPSASWLMEHLEQFAGWEFYKFCAVPHDRLTVVTYYYYPDESGRNAGVKQDIDGLMASDAIRHAVTYSGDAEGYGPTDFSGVDAGYGPGVRIPEDGASGMAGDVLDAGWVDDVTMLEPGDEGYGALVEQMRGAGDLTDAEYAEAKELDGGAGVEGEETRPPIVEPWAVALIAAALAVVAGCAAAIRRRGPARAERPARRR